MSAKQRKLIIRLIISGVLFLFAILLPIPEKFKIFAFLPPYLAVGYTVLFKAGRNIMNGSVFDENFLMALATLGAFVIGEYPEAVFVMMFYQTGELFESIAVGKSRRSISALTDLRPDTADVIRDGEMITVSPDEVGVGEMLVVRAGEKIPLDGIITEGSTTVNTVALTGEALPREVSVGDKVISGCINMGGVIKVKAEKTFYESTASKILELAQSSGEKKAKAESFISKFAKYYTPIVVVSAIIMGVVPPMFSGGFREWLYRAMSFLVISCPCALVISVPLSFFAGLGCASKNGILIKGSCYLERLCNAEVTVFDKTGTLTEGSFKVRKTIPEGISEDELIELAAYAEYYSNHPIAASVREAYGRDIDRDRIKDAEDIVGKGVFAKIDGAAVYAGNVKLMEMIGLGISEKEEMGAKVYVALKKDDTVTYLGKIVISDSVKSTSKEALGKLKSLGIKRTVMLSGDTAENAERTARELSVDEYRSELLPEDKVSELESIIEGGARGVVFVGDGINDAPVLRRADVGVAMGALGSDAAIESADVVIMDDDLRRLATAVAIARRTLSIVRQNIAFTILVKVAVLILSALGICGMWQAVFADVGVMVIAVLNAMRALYAD